MKKRVLLSALAATFLFCSASFAKDTGSKASVSKLHTQKEQGVINSRVESEKKLAKVTFKEVQEGFESVLNAIKWIEADKIKEAEDALKVAVKKFDLSLKNNPELKMVPVDSTTIVYEFAAGEKEIKENVKKAKKLLSDYRVQAAREILIPMKDDIEITTLYIPMDTYPLAIKTALKELQQGKKDAALMTLKAVMNTVVVSKVTIPISLVLAQDLIRKASKTDKNKKDEIEKLLKKAKEELKIAYLLGYTDKHDKEYKDLIAQIENIEKEMKGENKVEKLYSHLKNSFETLFKSIKSQAYKDSVAQKEEKALLNPSSVKGEAAAKAKIEETESKDLFEAKEKMRAFENEVKKDLKNK